jgi:hypothetical protein
VLCDIRESVVLLRGEPKDNMERDLAEIRKAKAEISARQVAKAQQHQQHQRILKSILKASGGSNLYSTV